MNHCCLVLVSIHCSFLVPLVFPGFELVPLKNGEATLMLEPVSRKRNICCLDQLNVTIFCNKVTSELNEGRLVGEPVLKCLSHNYPFNPFCSFFMF